MAKSPKANMEKLERVLTAWQTISNDKRFGGMSVNDFESFVNASRNSRVLINTIEDQKTEALAQRESNDEIGLGKLELVVAGVLADPTEGANSALYEAMGYVKKSDRKSGLTRKKKVPKP
jgi:hypothetical protein